MPATRITVSLPQDVYDALAVEAEESGRKLTQVLRFVTLPSETPNPFYAFYYENIQTPIANAIVAALKVLGSMAWDQALLKFGSDVLSSLVASALLVALSKLFRGSKQRE